MGAQTLTSKGKILVVDDDRLVLATVVHGLSQAGYQVIDTDNGDDAILLAREHKPELALLDIRMEGLSGFDVAEYLRQSSQTPFMFLSAFADEATLAQVKQLGAVAYLVKPLDIHQIVPAVEAAFANIKQGKMPSPVAGPTDAANIVAMAQGVLMHRYSLSRQEALAQLQAQADAEKRPLADQAQRLVEAVELLAASRPA